MLKQAIAYTAAEAAKAAVLAITRDSRRQNVITCIYVIRTPHVTADRKMHAIKMHPNLPYVLFHIRQIILHRYWNECLDISQGVLILAQRSGCWFRCLDIGSDIQILVKASGY